MFKSFMQSMIDARQSTANREVAAMLKREYPNESIDYIMEMVQGGRIEELRK